MPKSRKKNPHSGRKSPVRADHSSSEVVLRAMVNLISLCLALAEHDFEPFTALEFPPNLQDAAEEATTAMRALVLVYATGGMEVFTASMMVLGQTLLNAVSLFGDEEQMRYLPDMSHLSKVMGELERRQVVPVPVYRDGAQWVGPVDIQRAKEMAAQMRAGQK